MEQLDPENIAIRRQFSIGFWRTIWLMPPELRCIITHLHICDKTHDELADLMHMSTTAIQGLHEQALEYLRERMIVLD